MEEVAKNVVECGKMECHNYVIFEGISTSAKQKYIIFICLLEEMCLKLGVLSKFLERVCGSDDRLAAPGMIGTVFKSEKKM